jgi:hypothetical protein
MSKPKDVIKQIKKNTRMNYMRAVFVFHGCLRAGSYQQTGATAPVEKPFKAERRISEYTAAPTCGAAATRHTTI